MGIGAWSDDDSVRAVRDGVRKDGQHLDPAFPYTSYTRLSRDDVLAIKAYLFSLAKMDEWNSGAYFADVVFISRNRAEPIR